jgi:MFS family permease
MYPAGALVAGIPGGIAAARLGVKPTVLIGLTLLTLTTIAFGLADSVWSLDLARFLQGISSAFSWTGSLAWLVAAAPPQRRGQLIGSAFGAAIVGALFGPVLGAVASFTGTAAAFGAVAGLAVVLAVAAWNTPAATPADPQPLRMLFRALKVRRIQIPIWLCLLPALLFGNLSVLAPLRLHELGFGAAAIGAAFLVSAGFEALLSPLLGRLSDRRGAANLVRVAVLASAAVSLALPWARNAWLLAALVVAAGLAYGAFWVPAMSSLSEGAEQTGLEQSFAFALMNLAWAAGQGVGSLLGGALGERAGDLVPYAGGAALCVATLLALGLTRRASAAYPEPT